MREAHNNDNSRRRDVRFLHRRWQVLVFAVAASALSLASYWYQQSQHPLLLESLDQRTRDIVFRLRQPPRPPAEIVIVTVDEPSIKDYGRWPWPRALQGELIGRIKQYAGSVALDIVFAQPYSNAAEGQQQDSALIAALQAPGAPVVGGYFFRNHKSRLTDDAALDQLFDNRVKIKLMGPGSDLDDVQYYEFAETNQAHIAEHFAGLGAFNRDTDVDGLVRRAPLILRYRDEIFPTLALRALAVYAGVNEGLVAAQEGITEVRLDTFGIPVDEHGRLIANFYSQNELSAGIPMYSAADVLSGVVGEQQLADRLVFVGVTEIGVADLLPTPVNPIFPGVAMHATIAANILQEEYLYSNWDTVLIDIALTTLIPLIGVLVLARLRQLWQMLVASLLFMASLGGLFYWLVAYKGQLVSLLYPSAAMLTAFVSFGSYYVLTSQRTTRFLTGAFGSYVSPDVVDQLLSQPDSLGLSGEKREVTLLFSDIRGFTGISEKLEPERLVEMLNHYFDAMTQTILDRQGTLDKYIGDAIMAIFNAPLTLENHQLAAARSALDMDQRLQDMQPELRTRFGIELHIGIGLHSGEVVVGNLGSSQRFDYTAIGDAVNLASRVESITKLYGVTIIVTDAIKQQLDSEFILRPLDKIQVKGKTVPVDIYELMQPNEHNARLAAQFGKMFSVYLRGEFELARQSLLELQVNYPDDQPVRLYLQRCSEFLQQPPGQDWDGVYAAQGK